MKDIVVQLENTVFAKIKSNDKIIFCPIVLLVVCIYSQTGPILFLNNGYLKREK